MLLSTLEIINVFHKIQDNNKEFVTGRPEAEAKHREFRFSVTPEELAVGYYYDRQVKVDKGHAQEMEAFRKCAAENLPSPIDLYSGAAANILAYRAVQSCNEQRRIVLDLPAELGC